MSETKPTPVVVLKEKEMLATTYIMGEVVTTLPKALQEKGRQLVSRLKTTQWNDRGELLHEGVVVPGSIVVDLVHDLLCKLCRLDLERTGSVGDRLTDCAQGWAVRKQ